VSRLTRLTRGGEPAAPVRLAHLGVGNFFRAHQAWYTAHAPDAADWGYAAFTGRSPAVARELTGQDGLYTLITRAADGDRTEVVASLSRVHAGDDAPAWLAALSDPGVAVVSTTVTEAGYRREAGGGLDRSDPDVAADLDLLRSPGSASSGARTAPGKLVLGLAARRRADAGPVALMPCDNVPDNAGMLRRVVLDLAEAADPTLAAWIHEQVGFVSTMVDRITPRTTGEDRRRLLDSSGVEDPACVVTEPFSEWVVGGRFPAGRPRWQDAGARFVADVEPWEQRKLWLLNGSHSLMAYAGPLRGAATVAEAIADPVLLGWVEQWWDDAQGGLDLPAAETAGYRAALLERYRNPRIRHLLAQIAADGSQKVPIRVLPTLRRARAQGQLPAGAVRVVSAWTLHLLGHGVEVSDPAADSLRDRIRALAPAQAVRVVLDHLGVDDPDVTALAADQAQEMLPAGTRG
jgi:fructuronate reductase